MKIIPVLDILEGVVVQAKRGLRERYRPVKSILCAGSDPLDMVSVFRSDFDFDEIYVADLDAIMNRGENMKIVEEICSNFDLKVMVDAGVKSISAARRLIEAGVDSVIVGTETLNEMRQLLSIIDSVGSDRILVSMDFSGSQILSHCRDILGQEPPYLAHSFSSMKVSGIIVLDLDRVGSQNGPNLDLIKTVVSASDIPVIAGGGIRDLDDLKSLKELDVSAALIATALHRGIVKKNDLVMLREF